MKYEDIRCGMNVVTPMGEVAEVVSYEANMNLTLSGGGFQKRREKSLKAEVQFADGTRKSFYISLLKPA